MNYKSILFLFMALMAFSFTEQTNDNCQPYFPMSKGTTWEYNDYDKKGELSGTNTTIVEAINEVDGRIEYQLKAIFDGPKKKEKEHYEADVKYVCEDGVFKMSMENMIDQRTLESFGESATVTIEQSEMIFPNSLNAGDQLDDAFVTLKVDMSGMNVMNMQVDITERKCEKIESITTEAGTYSCALISYRVQSKMAFVNTDSRVKDWYSSEVGIVQSESYDEKGNLSSSRKLVSYTPGE